MRRIGIMQGRLLPPEKGRFQSFPREGWMDEFALAAAAKLDSIEWIYDEWGAKENPIGSESGVVEVTNLAERHAVDVVSLCADYFMERPLIRANAQEQRDRIQHLRWLVLRCQRLGISRIVLPFVDNSSIESESEAAEIIAMLRDILPEAAQAGVEIHLETSLRPSAFAAILDELPFPAVMVNYDTGNSASLGYDFREEFSAYGDRIGSVHIKDRIRGGGTVPLGQGNAEIPAILTAIQELGYSGDLILQVARGESGREVEWAEHNRLTLMTYLQAGATASEYLR